MTKLFLHHRYLLHICTACALFLSNIAQAQLDYPATGEKMMATQTLAQHVSTKTTAISTNLDWAYRVAWSPDSKYFAVIGMEGSGGSTTFSVVVYDASTHKMIQTLPVNAKKPGSLLGDIAFSPDGKYLAAGIGVITLWDAKTWQPVRDIEGPYDRGLVSGGVKSIAFNPDSKTLVVFYDSVVWPETVKILTREEGAALGAKVDAAKKDGTFWEKLSNSKIVSNLGTIMAFDVETKKRLFVQAVPVPTPEKNARFTGNLTYTEDGKYLLSSRIEHRQLERGEPFRHFTFLEFRDPQTGQIIKEVADPHVMQVTAMAVSPDGKYIATGTDTLSKESTLNTFTKGWDLIDNQDPIRLWDIADGKKLMEFGPLRGAVLSLAFSPDGTLLVSCQTDLEKKETVWLWDVKTGEIIERVTTPLSGSEFFACSMSPNGHTIAMPVKGKIYLISVKY